MQLGQELISKYESMRLSFALIAFTVLVIFIQHNKYTYVHHKRVLRKRRVVKMEMRLHWMPSQSERIHTKTRLPKNEAVLRIWLRPNE